ncbi:MAG: hypothetical protein EXS38_11275 [Opitutus sp.]|nr:hypothetical protein [Opitutus sp.]
MGAKTAVADAGYHERGQLQACEQAVLTAHVPAPANCSDRTADGEAVYPKEKFTYDPLQNCYRCPAGQTLARGRNMGSRATTILTGRPARRGRSDRSARRQPYRKLLDLANEDVVERQAARVAAHPEIVAQRKEIVEHVFGPMHQWGQDKFLCRGLAMVRGEFTLTALAYNLRRALTVCGVACLLAAPQTA